MAFALSQSEYVACINMGHSPIPLENKSPLKPVIDFETAAHGDNTQFNSYFHGMLNESIYLPPSAFESYFLNDALSNEDIDKTVESFSSVINKF